jgi:quercetin dioxygenase-like cupin family protein
MPSRICTAALLLITAFAPISRASAEDNVIPSVPLLSTGTTIVGETLHYPTNGPAHVTAAIVTLAPGAKTVLHRHGVPLFAYILEGEITVDYGDRGKRTYRAGDALMEAVRILTVFIGAEGAPADVIPVKP